VGGYWVSEEAVEAIDQVVIDDLIGRHARARIELRITPSIWPFWRRVANSTVEYSGSRLRNAAVDAEGGGGRVADVDVLSRSRVVSQLG
jgi:hypothetical protein